MVKRILVLGGGRWQTDLILRIRDLGIQTVVTDILPDPPGRAFADTFVQIDTNDKEGLLRIAEKHKVDLVLAEQSDRLVPIAAFLNENLSLPGILPEIALKFSNKLEMRNALRLTDIPMPRYQEVRTVDEVRKIAATWGYPIILKPKDSQSSLGVSLIRNDQALSTQFASSIEYSRDRSLLAEEFVDGTEITVEGLSLGGACKILAISEKAHYAHNPCVARRLAYPPRFPLSLITTIRSIAQRVAEHLGLFHGITHAEYRVRNGIPYLIEIAARGGGNAIASKIVRHVSGIDIYAMLIRALSGENVVLGRVQERAAVLEFFTFRPGKIAAIHGVKSAIDEGVANELSLAFVPGDEIHLPSDDRNRPGYFISLGNSRDEVDANARRVNELIRIVYAKQ